MTEEDQAGDEGAQKSARQKMGDGIKQGIGVLSAFKDALEETIQEARDRGDLSAERAKEVMKDALGKAQAAATDARERLDFANQAEMDSLRAAVSAAEARLAALEESVFGESKGEAGSAEGGGSTDEGAPQEG